MDIKILIATHKEYNLIKNDLYFPIFLGAATLDLDLPYQRDDEGENISSKNKTYCELTGLYWACKNLKADYIGLFHYRRYLDLKCINIEEHELILPRKRHYYIETVYDQFGHAHGYQGLDIAREIISKDYPGYLNSFDRCMKKKSLHIYNMFVMRYDHLVQYCDFLFDILFKIEKEMGDMDRLYGYLGERMLDVYIEANKIPYTETDIIETERTDWIKKIYCFLKRKYFGGNS